MARLEPQDDSNDPQVDAVVGRRLFEVKSGVTATRTVREGLLQLADALSRRPGHEGALVLPRLQITRERLGQEWRRVTHLLRRDLASRITVYFDLGEGFEGIPRSPDRPALNVIAKLVAREASTGMTPPARGDAAFNVLKVLLHHFLTSGGPVSTEWLMRASGHSYPTTAAVLAQLGSVVERTSDRRIQLRWIPSELLRRLYALSERARMTARFADRSGQPRSVEAHLRRLERLAPSDLAVGGVLGALHHVPQLDITGAPRLELSQHRPKSRLDLRFIADLDPALERVQDPLAPATVVVHAVRHASSLFVPRAGGLSWADSVECLLDLNEAGLPRQANQFAEALSRLRETRE